MSIKNKLSKILSKFFWTTEYDSEGNSTSMTHRIHATWWSWLEHTLWQVLKLPCNGCHGLGGCCSCGGDDNKLDVH